LPREEKSRRFPIRPESAGDEPAAMHKIDGMPRSSRTSRKTIDELRNLLRVCGRLKFEPHDLASQLDSRGRYTLPMDEEFPFHIRLFHFTSRRHTRGATWHEQLELFLPLDGPARFRMGDREIVLERGDLLVVDNLKLHNVVDFPGFDTRVVVVSFMPEFVYSLGSPSHDYAFLLPFYSRMRPEAHVLRSSDAAAPEAWRALARMLECYFGADRHYFQAGAKAFLLELLFVLARRFRGSEVMQWEFMRQRQRSLELKKVFEHIQHRYAEKITVDAAARLAGMSASRLMKTFKRVAGMTLVAYVNHVRLANAARLLRETSRNVAEIAFDVGFSDQSYFDKRFKRAFGLSPLKFRTDRIKGQNHPSNAVRSRATPAGRIVQT
jgi:AraC-like DNA-binding protein